MPEATTTTATTKKAKAPKKSNKKSEPAPLSFMARQRIGGTGVPIRKDKGPYDSAPTYVLMANAEAGISDALTFVGAEWQPVTAAAAELLADVDVTSLHVPGDDGWRARFDILSVGEFEKRRAERTKKIDAEARGLVQDAMVVAARQVLREVGADDSFVVKGARK